MGDLSNVDIEQRFITRAIFLDERIPVVADTESALILKEFIKAKPNTNNGSVIDYKPDEDKERTIELERNRLAQASMKEIDDRQRVIEKEVELKGEIFGSRLANWNTPEGEIRVAQIATRLKKAGINEIREISVRDQKGFLGIPKFSPNEVGELNRQAGEIIAAENFLKKDEVPNDRDNSTPVAGDLHVHWENGFRKGWNRKMEESKKAVKGD